MTEDSGADSCGRNADEKGRSLSHLTVFCDFDGPILDVSDRYYQTYQLALAEVQSNCQAEGVSLALQPLDKQQFWSMKQNRVPDLDVALRSGLPESYFEAFRAHVLRIVNQPALLHQDRVQPGVRWALSLLHAQGARLILVTLRCQQQALQILRQEGLAPLFTDIRGTNDTNAAYCNQADHKVRLLADVMTDHAITPSAFTWMIGDTEADVLAGKANAVPTIAITSGIRSATYLNRFHPTRIHTDLLSAAHFLVYQHETFPAMVG